MSDSYYIDVHCRNCGTRQTVSYLKGQRVNTKDGARIAPEVSFELREKLCIECGCESLVQSRKERISDL